MYPQLQDIDFRLDVSDLDVPVYLVQGRYEARGRAELAAEWFEMLNAPHKRAHRARHLRAPAHLRTTRTVPRRDD